MSGDVASSGVQVGDGARKTNKDYTQGSLPELIDIIIAEKAALFICAVGVPPKWAVDKLHAAKIPIMNMIGAGRPPFSNTIYMYYK